MTGVESIVRRMFQGRARRWSIIIVNAALALALGLPAVDEYLAQRQREGELSSQLEQAEQQVQLASDLRSRATAVARELSEMEGRALFERDAQAYRQALVQMIRKSGCQMRRLSLDDAARRPWEEKNDHPLDKPKRPTRGKSEEDSSGYQLRTQTVSLSVSGTLQDAKTLLTEIQAGGKFIHTTSLSIRPNGRERDSVVMDVQFQLFGLEKAKAASGPA